MCYIYVLKSLKNNKRYVGCTKVLPFERLKQHNYGTNKWTRQNRPFRLIYTKKYKTFTEARKRENFLKSGVGKQELNKVLGA